MPAIPRRGLAILHASAAALGLVVLPTSALPSDLFKGFSFAVFLGFLAASAWTGFLLWRDDPRGRAWSIGLLVAQVPQLATPMLTYSLVGPLAITAKVESNWDVGFVAELTTRFRLQWRGEVEPRMFGLNLVAAICLYLWLRAERKAPELPTSGGLVIR